jgi:hypothetical protein
MKHRGYGAKSFGSLRILQLGCIGLMFNISVASADRSLRLSTAHLVAESSSVRVTHDHDVQQVKESGVPVDGAIRLNLNSTLRIVRKSDNAEIFNQAVPPLTALTSVNDGRYFAGLSNLQTLSAQYNFLLISADGKIVTTALITPSSGHCRSVSLTTTNFIRWFNEKAPDVRLSRVGRQVFVTIANPYDASAGGVEGKCIIQMPATER